MAIQVGTSGWSYDHWQGVLYPPGTAVRDRLAFYVAQFRTVEINATFYRWPRPATFASWQRRLPEGFQMAVKAPRGLSHARKLYEPEQWIERIAAGLHSLYDKRGPLLVQLPPTLDYDLERLRYFLQKAPWWFRIAIEFRHPGWHREETYQVLEEYGAAYCVMSGANLRCELRATAPLVYARLHGPDYGWLYSGSYSDDDLAWWADRAREWDAQGRDVYLYFNNDLEGHAVRNAHRLRQLLGQVG